MQAAQGVDAIEFEGQLILAHEQRQLIVVLNNTARLLWEMMEAGISARQMAASLARRYGVSRLAARADVAAIVRQWRAQGLLARRTARPAPEAKRLGEPAPSRAGGGRRRWRRRQFHLQHVYSFSGITCRLRIDDARIGTAIHQLLAHSEEPGGVAKHQLDLVREYDQYVLIQNGTELHRGASAQQAAGLVVRALCDLRYPHADWLMFMHAAAVAEGDQAVVLAGPSGSGKSTLTAALLHSGLTYLSDDVVPLDRHTLRIVPVPFGISLKEGSWSLLSRHYPELMKLPVEENAGHKRKYLPPHGRQSVPLSAGALVKYLIFLRFQSERPPMLRSLAPLPALAKLAETGTPLPLDKAGLRLLLQWIRGVHTYELNCSDLGRAAEIVVGLCKL